MCALPSFLGGGEQKAPPPPPQVAAAAPVAPAIDAQGQNAQTQAARTGAKQQALAAQGNQSTVLTQGQDLGEAEIGKRKLLG